MSQGDTQLGTTQNRRCTAARGRIRIYTPSRNHCGAFVCEISRSRWAQHATNAPTSSGFRHMPLNRMSLLLIGSPALEYAASRPQRVRCCRRPATVCDLSRIPCPTFPRAYPPNTRMWLSVGAGQAYLRLSAPKIWGMGRGSWRGIPMAQCIEPGAGFLGASAPLR